MLKKRMISGMKLRQIIAGDERKDKRNVREKGDDISSSVEGKKAKRHAELTECNLRKADMRRNRGKI